MYAIADLWYKMRMSCRSETSADAFFDRLSDGRAILELFEYLPAVYVFIKDDSGRFVHVNRDLQHVLGVEESRIVGLTDHDLFAADLADRYVEEDRQVMRTGRTLAHRVWLVPDRAGLLRWFLSTKMPLRDRSRRAIGVAAVMQDVAKSGAVLEPYQRLGVVLQYVNDHYAGPLSVATLAAQARLSVSQLIRCFRRYFARTPGQYIRRVRINAAQRLLITTNHTIDQIARDCGFYDASHFVKQFKRELKTTPHAYRRRRAGR